MDKSRNESANPARSERRVWTKPTLRVHGDLATLTRAKTPNGFDSGLGNTVS
ncbi:MAG: hypothetical protein H6737_09815 [Alphaproteobacteria bacterium]|nr:hypothetical protein [Alphaproteobacteria bacterium]